MIKKNDMNLCPTSLLSKGMPVLFYDSLLRNRQQEKDQRKKQKDEQKRQKVFHLQNDRDSDEDPETQDPDNIKNLEVMLSHDRK